MSALYVLSERSQSMSRHLEVIISRFTIVLNHWKDFAVGSVCSFSVCVFFFLFSFLFFSVEADVLELVCSWISKVLLNRRIASPQDESHIQNYFAPVQNTSS